MKFGRQLIEESDPRFRHFYISYKDLKQAIKLITGSDGSSFSIQQVTHNFGNLPALAGSVFRPPESRFQDLLNHEKEKINKFMDINLSATTAALKQLLKDLLREDKNDAGYIEDLEEAEKEISQQAEMVIFLQGYQRINMIGFRKITKKYDKHNNSQSAHWYLAQLQRESFVNADFNVPLKLLSLSSQVLLARSIGVFGKQALLSGTIDLLNGLNPDLSAMQTTRYLVRQEDVMKVKVFFARCLPLVSVGTGWFIGREAVDVLINPLAAIQSHSSGSEAVSHSYLYLDTPTMEISRELLNHTRTHAPIKGSDTKVVRIRWFGIHDGEGDKDVYVERISLTDLCRTMPETTDLFNECFQVRNGEVVMIKYKHLQSIATFNIDAWIKRKQVSASCVDSVKKLLYYVKEKLTSRELIPICQTWYLRTSFKLSTGGEKSDSVVEVHVDENCSSVAEIDVADNVLQIPSADNSENTSLITAYTKVKSTEVRHVEDRFCVLSITHPAEFTFPYKVNRPRAEVTDSHLFESVAETLNIEDFKGCINMLASTYEAPSFTSLAHAVAALYKETKPFKIPIPHWFSSTLVCDEVEEEKKEEKKTEPLSENYNSSRARVYHELASSGGGDLLPPPAFSHAPGGGGFLGLDATAIAIQEELSAPLIHPRPSQPTTGQQARNVGHQSWWRTAFGTKKLFGGRKERKGDKILPTGASVRVEPKTFFANERTLLQWMNIAALLSTISITLMSFGTLISRIAGFLISPIALFFIFHSYHVYNYRTEALMNKEPIDYVDHRGPLVLVVSLVFAIGTVIFLNIIKAFAGV